MGMFLNSIEPYDKYKTITKGFYFVDKTELLEELIPALEQEQRFLWKAKKQIKCFVE